MAFGDLAAEDSLHISDYHCNHWLLDAGGRGGLPPIEEPRKNPWEPGRGPGHASHGSFLKACAVTLMGLVVVSYSMPIVVVCARVCEQPPQPRAPDRTELTSAQKTALLYRGF